LYLPTVTKNEFYIPYNILFSLLAVLKMADYINADLGKENVTPDSMPPATKEMTPPPKKAVWLMADDAEMIRVLTEQQAAGNQLDNGWKSLVWTLVAKALQGSEMRSGGAAKTAASCSGHWGKVSGSEMVFGIPLLMYEYSSRATSSQSRPSGICPDGVGMIYST
jgi:hypothetical protein